MPLKKPVKIEGGSTADGCLGLLKGGLQDILDGLGSWSGERRPPSQMDSKFFCDWRPRVT